MTDYLAVVPKYMSGHKKKTRLIIASVALAVALVTAVFSMLDFLMQYEKLSVLKETGNYHIALKDPTDAEKQAIESRIDVANSGSSVTLKNGSLHGKECMLAAIDERFAADMNFSLTEGVYPVQNEIMLEEWAAGDLNLHAGDTVTLSLDDGSQRQCRISGLFEDFGGTKAKGMPGVLLSVQNAVSLGNEKRTILFVRFKDGVNIGEAVTDIQNNLGIAPDRIGRNEKLLAVIGQSKDARATQMYAAGAILFVIVLVAGVLMISNTFNISVMERIRQFGLLRCIGASRSQVKKIVRREGVYVLLRALPIGLALGIGVGLLCTLILKLLVNVFYGDMNVLNVSLIGIAAGAAIGVLSVFLASSSPAKKASRVSPVNAVTGSSELSVSKKRKQGWLTRMFRVETALGLNNAFLKKKTFVLMALSIAISIIMLFGFQVFVDFMYSSIKTTKPYTPDISITSEQPISGDLQAKIAALTGVDKAYGRMFGYVDASFDPSRLTESYRVEMGGIEQTGDGYFIPKEKSWLISYDQNQFDWAKEDLVDGKLSEKDLNEKGGVIAVAAHLRNNITFDTCSLQLGDKVRIETPDGPKEMTVMGILRTVPFSSAELCMTAFITTEQNYTMLTGEKSYEMLDVQLHSTGQEQTLSDIKGMLGSGYMVLDQRQKNAENDQIFLTMAVFIYGFLAVIALISILNIVNTMNTSVASKTRYLGVLRAVGISGRQLQKMIWTEAAAYSLTGCIFGCTLGILLQKVLMDNMLTRYHFTWDFPWLQTVLIFAGILAVAALSIIGPLKRIRRQGISEVIGSL